MLPVARQASDSLTNKASSVTQLAPSAVLSKHLITTSTCQHANRPRETTSTRKCWVSASGDAEKSFKHKTLSRQKLGEVKTVKALDRIRNRGFPAAAWRPQTLIRGNRKQRPAGEDHCFRQDTPRHIYLASITQQKTESKQASAKFTAMPSAEEGVPRTPVNGKGATRNASTQIIGITCFYKSFSLALQ